MNRGHKAQKGYCKAFYCATVGAAICCEKCTKPCKSPCMNKSDKCNMYTENIVTRNEKGQLLEHRIIVCREEC